MANKRRLRIASYNINGINSRLHVLTRWLDAFRPDFILVSTDWKEEEHGLLHSRHITASNLVAEIMRAPHPPKEVLLFGSRMVFSDVQCRISALRLSYKVQTTAGASKLQSGVFTTSLSTPGVCRPWFVCVTRRTLSSVFA